MYRVWHRLQRLKADLKWVIDSGEYVLNVKETCASVEALHNQELKSIIQDDEGFGSELDALVEVLEPTYTPIAGKFYYYAQQI
jgi:hypothetical protein